MISTDLEVLELEGKTLKLTINPVDTSEATNTTWGCKTPTGEEHRIPILNTCPPAPGPKWLLDSLSVKKKASKKKSRRQPRVMLLRPFNVSNSRRITVSGMQAEDVRASDDALEDYIVGNFKRPVEEIELKPATTFTERKETQDIISPLSKVAGRRS